MATKTASVSGNWSNIATWGGSAVPVNGDAVVINSGVEILFDVDQSGFANGLLSLTVNGILTLKNDIVTYLKSNGDISIGTTGKISVGTQLNPIHAPTNSIPEVATIALGGAHKVKTNFNPNLFEAFGEEREQFDELAQAQLNTDSTIKLKTGLNLRAGDKLSIENDAKNGYGNYYDNTPNGATTHTILSYDSSTKVVTLTTAIGRSLKQNFMVQLLSRNILFTNIQKTAATPFIDSLMAGKINGVRFYNFAVQPIAYSEYSEYSHCTVDTCNFGLCAGVKDIFRHVASINCSYNGIMGSPQDGITGGLGFGELYDCSVMNCHEGGLVRNVFNSIIKDCRSANAQIANTAINSQIINCKGTSAINNINGCFNVICKNIESESAVHDCLFTTDTKLYNSKLSKFEQYAENQENTYPVWSEWFNGNSVIESYDHNQIPGNYAAICKGGKIITENNKLKFICESSSYPVFRDYKVLVSKNVIERLSIAGTKDFTGGIAKAELIDPANDPLIDPTAVPLASSVMEDTKDTNLSMNITHKATKAQELILRISAMNSTGNYILNKINRLNRRRMEVIQ